MVYSWKGVKLMTFQQLQYILEVHKTGSVSKAAENLFVSRSSVSSSISSLENELGISIFDRTLQGLIPSQKGRQILEYAERICKTHQLMTSVSDTNESRLVSIGINEYTPVTQAAAALVDTCKERKDIRFSFGVYAINDILDKLSLFEMDCAVFSRLGNNQLNIEDKLEKRGLLWKKLGTVPTTLIIGNAHPMAAKEDLSLRDLEDAIFLDTVAKEISRNSYIRSIMKVNPDRILCTNNTSLRFQLLRDGNGYTVGKKPNAMLIKNYDLRCIPIPALSQPLLFAMNPARPLSAEAELFLHLLEARLPDWEE